MAPHRASSDRTAGELAVPRPVPIEIEAEGRGDVGTTIRTIRNDETQVMKTPVEGRQFSGESA
jgi:hypothetical protein